MRKALLAMAFVVIVIFVYLVVTDPSFRSYTENSIKGINMTIPESQFIALYNSSRNMSEGQFINWSLSPGNNNQVINGLKASATDANTLISKLGGLWDAISSLKNATTPSQIYNSLKSNFTGMTSANQ